MRKIFDVFTFSIYDGARTKSRHEGSEGTAVGYHRTSKLLINRFLLPMFSCSFVTTCNLPVLRNFSTYCLLASAFPIGFNPYPNVCVRLARKSFIPRYIYTLGGTWTCFSKYNRIKLINILAMRSHYPPYQTVARSAACVNAYPFGVLWAQLFVGYMLNKLYVVARELLKHLIAEMPCHR